ncbi:MAG: PEP-CTERM sorting domain-containing protein [Planctomycetota bacterium]
MSRTLLTLVAVMALAGTATAGIISINVNEANGRVPMGPNDVAGAAPEIRVGNWNNYECGTVSLPAEIDSPVAGAFVDDGGTPVGGDVAIEVAGPGGWVGATSATNDRLMYTGAHMLMADGGTVTYTLTDIPFALYDLYVYAQGQSVSGANFRGGSVELDGGPVYYTQGGNSPDESGDGYVPMTTTSIPASPVEDDIAFGNYAVFGGLTGADQTLTATSYLWTDHARMQVYGLQIVEVPEPATLGLLALGGLAVLKRRRA